MNQGTLTCLTELKVAVAPTSFTTRPFSCDFSALFGLKQLRSLDIACTARVAQVTQDGMDQIKAF